MRVFRRRKTFVAAKASGKEDHRDGTTLLDVLTHDVWQQLPDAWLASAPEFLCADVLKHNAAVVLARNSNAVYQAAFACEPGSIRGLLQRSFNTRPNTEDDPSWLSMAPTNKDAYVFGTRDSYQFSSDEVWLVAQLIETWLAGVIGASPTPPCAASSDQHYHKELRKLSYAHGYVRALVHRRAASECKLTGDHLEQLLELGFVDRLRGFGEVLFPIENQYRYQLACNDVHAWYTHEVSTSAAKTLRQLSSSQLIQVFSLLATRSPLRTTQDTVIEDVLLTVTSV